MIRMGIDSGLGRVCPRTPSRAPAPTHEPKIMKAIPKKLSRIDWLPKERQVPKPVRSALVYA
jgi:hypothetical protein